MTDALPTSAVERRRRCAPAPAGCRVSIRRSPSARLSRLPLPPGITPAAVAELGGIACVDFLAGAQSAHTRLLSRAVAQLLAKQSTEAGTCLALGAGAALV